MNIILTGEKLGIDNDELLDVEFNVDLDDEALEYDRIQIECVSNDSDCNVLHLIDQNYANKFIHQILSAMKYDKLTEMQAMQKDIYL